MIEALVSDPEKVTLLVALLVLIAMFIRGDVMPGKTHDRIVAHLKEGYDKRIESAEKREETWKQFAVRSTDLTEASASSLTHITKKIINERGEG